MAEVYIPTLEETQHVLQKGDFLKVSGDGVFATLQGEGDTAGEKAVFLRLQNCNLHCGANGQGWQCDAWYTWDRTTPEFWKEVINMPVSEVADQVSTAWTSTFDESDGRRLVITGGEPLLQQKKIPRLLALLDGWAIEIETNGTITPAQELQDAQINCSPKLSSSGNGQRARFRPNVLNAIAALPNSWFKFVISSDTDVDEVQDIVLQTDISYDRVLLMSEGTDPETLSKSDEKLADIAKDLGCMVTARNQIFWFGNTRAT